MPVISLQSFDVGKDTRKKKKKKKKKKKRKKWGRNVGGRARQQRTGRGGAGEGRRPPRVLAPLQGSSLFLHLKSLREAPPPAGGEGPRWAGRGGARALWKALFSGKERKKREGGGSVGGNMAAAARERKEGRSRQATSEASVVFLFLYLVHKL